VITVRRRRETGRRANTVAQRAGGTGLFVDTDVLLWVGSSGVCRSLDPL